MGRNNFTYLRRTLWLLPIPLLWILLSSLGHLQSLQNMAMDWRFRVRGPIESPVKVFYINRDETSSQTFGADPFPRSIYANTAEVALNNGAKAIFFDFVLSPIGTSTLVDRSKLVEQDAAMADIIQQNPNKIILGSSYGGVVLPFAKIPSYLPLKRKSTLSAGDDESNYDRASNPFPESPTYPLWSISYLAGTMINKGWGRPAIINMDVDRSAGAIARWMPAYVETYGDYLSSNYALGYIRWLTLTQPELGGVYLDRPLKDGGDPKKPEDFEPYFNIRNRQEILDQIPAILPYTFHTVAIELLAAANGVDHNSIIIEPNRVKIQDFFHGVTLYDIPLRDDQVLEVNWFSKWYSLPLADSDLQNAVTVVLETSTMLGAHEELRTAFWSLPADELSATLNDLYSFNELRKKLTPTKVNEAITYLLNYPSDPYNPMASMAVVLALADLQKWGNPQTATLAGKWLKRLDGAIVLCGPTDPLLQDVAPTPLDTNAVPRVSVHGNLLKTIVTHKYIKHVPNWSISLFVIGLTFLVTHLTMHAGRWTKTCKIGAFVLMMVYVGVVFVAFNLFDFVIPLIVPMGAALMTSIAGFAIQLFFEERAKSRIKGMFGTYLSPTLVNRMIDSGEEPKLGGSDENITAFFSDVQSFSSFSEILTPQQLVELMNEYLTAMTDILEKEEGTLDKYIGDAIVAMFGAPVNVKHPAAHACRAAILMQQGMADLRTKWISEGDKWPPLVHQMRMRIGLNSGRAIVGNMGSTKRFNFTMMGDTVNLAARCESGAKTAGVYSLISRECKEQTETTGDEFIFRFVDKWKVKGRSQPVDMYELVDFRANASAAALECVSLYEQALQCYFAQDWDAAKALFQQSLPLEPLQPDRDAGVHTNPSIEMIPRCESMKKNPPGANWDGVYEMKHK